MARNRSENPVVLSRIYTRTGDDGSTALADGNRTAKTDTRLAAYADVEEANCAIGMAITFGNLAADISGLLSRVQNELFDVGADLANPVTDAPPPYPPLRGDAAARGADRHAAGGTQRLGRGRRARRLGEPAARPVPEPAVRPAVHPRPPGQRGSRRRAVETRRRTRLRPGCYQPTRVDHGRADGAPAPLLVVFLR